MMIYPTPSTLTKFRANQWIDTLTQLDHVLKDKVRYDDQGYVAVLREIGSTVSREEMVRPVMAMVLERYRYHVLEGGVLVIRLMSNGINCAPTVSDGLNLEMFLAGVECNLGGVFIDPCLPIKYPDDAEMQLARQLTVLNTLIVRLELDL
jgi:hypothetical protein